MLQVAFIKNWQLIVQEQRDSVVRQAQVLRGQEQPIPGLDDVVLQEIEAVDQLCLDLINAIHLLGIVYTLFLIL
jgi:hypothetical protein